MLLWGCQKDVVVNQLPDEDDTYFKLLREGIEQRFFDYNSITSINPYLVDIKINKSEREGAEGIKSGTVLYSAFIEEIRQFYKDHKNIRKLIEKKVGYPMWDKLNELNIGEGKLAIIPIAHAKSEFVEAIIFVYKDSPSGNLKFHYTVRNKFNKYPKNVEFTANGKKKFDRAYIISQFLVFDKLIFEKADCDLLSQFYELVQPAKNNFKNLECDYSITLTNYYYVTISGSYVTVQYLRTDYEYDIICTESSSGDNSGGGGYPVGDPELEDLNDLTDINGTIITQTTTWKPDKTKDVPCIGAVTISSSIAPTLVGKPLSSGTFGWVRTYEDGSPKFHWGVDFEGNIGDPIYAPFDGIVERVSYWGTLGRQIWIVSEVNGKTIRYVLGHCSAIYPIDGDIVQAGALIALIGKTSTLSFPNPHVHVGIQEKIGDSWSDFINPFNYLTTQYDLNWTPTPCIR